MNECACGEPLPDLRVLAPGGTLVLITHGAFPDILRRVGLFSHPWEVDTSAPAAGRPLTRGRIPQVSYEALLYSESALLIRELRRG